MKLEEIIDLVENSFNFIQKAEKIEQVNEFIELNNLLTNDSDYPLLDLCITDDEINLLIDSGIIVLNNNRYQLSTSFASDNNQSPLVKLLYSIIWKNQDFINKNKDKLIIDAILGNENQSKSVVFFYLGKHLSDPKKFPIIDKNVIMVYQIYDEISKAEFKIENEDSESSIKEIINRKPLKNSKEDIELIEGYSKWIRKKINPELLKIDGFKVIDKLLFSLGKYIKENKQKIFQGE